MQHDYQQILVVLSAALGLSFTIERFLEILKKLFDKMLFRVEASPPDTKPHAEETKNNIELQQQQDENETLAEELAGLQVSLAKAESLSPARKAELRRRIRELEKRGVDTSKIEQDEKYSFATVFVDDMPPPDRLKIIRTFWLQILGTFAGIILCVISHFGLFAKLAGTQFSIPASFDYLFTGILIGAGSQPMHFLVEFLTKRKLTALKIDADAGENGPEEVGEGARTSTSSAEPQQTTIYPEIGVVYRGGVDLKRLANVHRRPKNPDLIVYHHTAMHSDTSFADVVKVIKDKGWLTGFHCVVQKDGSIHPFCRWDRYSNHVKGYNLTSLSIAFNGNYETNSHDEFANADGRYGLSSPTERQLMAAARVVALWTQLYDIPVDFTATILPHNQLSPTACPGSDFPHSQFQQLIRTVHDTWRNDANAQREIEVFKRKPYLYC